LEATKQVVTTGARGTKAGVTFVEDTVVGGIDKIEDVTGDTNGADPLPPLPKSIPPSSSSGVIDTAQNNRVQKRDEIEKALDNAASSGSLPAPNTVSGNAGWCYIGTDNGVRTCGEVGVNDQCMSGDIFPSQDICVNPRLRA